MSYKSFKERLQSCPLQKCSSISTPGELLSSQHWISYSSSSLLASHGEDRKPPKTSLKDKIAALAGSGSVKKSVAITSALIHSDSEKRVPSDQNDVARKKRSLLESSAEIDLYAEDGEEEGERVSRSRGFETSGAASSIRRSCLLPNKRSKYGPTSPPSDSLRRTNTPPEFPISSQDDQDEDGEGTQTAQLGNDEEQGMDSEAGLSVHPLPEGSFEPLQLWPRARESTMDENVEEERVIQVPASINSRLMEHQREGVLFLYDLYRKNRGGILGDDMGLGKTIQTIAFLAAILQKESNRKDSIFSTLSTKVGVPKQRCEKVALIICPTSVVQNWEHEFHSWGEFQVGVCHGQERESVLAKIVAKEVEIVLTSHETYRLHGYEFCKMDWECVVVDEAHRLKNDKSQFYIMCLKLPTMRRYGLTGTVMQNKYMELFNVFDWATPRSLGTRDHFREYYAVPIAEGQRISAPQRFVTIAEDRKKHLNLVLRDYFLRRTKEETIGHLMKGKEDNVVFCPMSSIQKRVYRRVLQSPDFQALKMKGSPCPCGSPLTRGECCYRTVPNGVLWPSLHKDNLDLGCDFCPYCLMLPCLTKLRLLSNHLELIKPNPKDDPEKQEKDYRFARMAFGEDVDIVGGIEEEQSFLSLSDSQHCGKMVILERLLASWVTQGDKVLLFSDSCRMLDILEKFVIRKGYCSSRLDGTIPMNSRQALVEEFNHSPSKQIFLISTRAGGLGLNLTGANRVVIFDPNWNPAHDLQAQDRSFRFGQNRHVTVFRLLAAGTLEELVYTRQIYKQQLFNIAMTGAAEKRYFEGVQGSKQHKGELFGMNNLFRDISEDLFAEDIIENHEERITRIQRMAAEEAETSHEHEHTEAHDPEEELDHRDNVTCDEPDSCGSPQVATKEQDRGKSEEETRVQRIVQEALTKSGVVYSHRNEDVVNLRSSFQNARKGVKFATHLLTSPKKQGDKLNSKQVPSKRKGNVGKQPHKVRPPAGQVSGKGRSAISSSQPMQQVSVEDKRALFAKLAKSKGMDISELSKWCLSANPKERTQMLGASESEARTPP